MSLFQPSLDDMVIEHPCTVEEARELTDRIKASVEQTWSLLLQAHERRAWAALGYQTWNDYVAGEFAMSKQRSFQLLDQGRAIRAISEAAESTDVDLHITEAQARDIKPVLPRLVEDVRERVASIPAPTPQRVQEVVREEVEKARAEVHARREKAEFEREFRPADFNPEREAELVAERGAFFRLCRDIAALGAPEEFLTRQRQHIRDDRISVIEEAYAWLHDFLTVWRDQ